MLRTNILGVGLLALPFHERISVALNLPDSTVPFAFPRVRRIHVIPGFHEPLLLAGHAVFAVGIVHVEVCPRHDSYQLACHPACFPAEKQGERCTAGGACRACIGIFAKEFEDPDTFSLESWTGWQSPPQHMRRAPSASRSRTVR